MTRRIFRAIFLASFAMIFVCTASLVLVTYNYYNVKEIEYVRIQTEFAAKAVEKLGIEYLEELISSDYRITWVAPDGMVIYDTHEQKDNMDNHKDREEIRDALIFGYGSGSRQSETMLLQQIYTAIRIEDGSVVRTATEGNTLWAFLLSMIQPLCLAVSISALLSLFIAKYLSQEIIRPLHELDLDHPLDNTSDYEEINPLLLQIQRQYQRIEHQLTELDRRQTEFDIITRDMAEGLLLLGQHGEILSLNDAASRYFVTDKTQCMGKNILTINRGRELQEILAKAYQGEKHEGLLPLGLKQYQINVSPIFESNSVTGVAVLLVDVTEKSESEQIRREFTANVSHELKTPLHTISGCAELLTHNIVKPEDIPHFAEQIYSEAQRLIRLVEEIISLSKLDEGAMMDLTDSVDLHCVAKDAIQHLEEMAKNSEVSLSYQGESSILQGSHTLISGIVHNLTENAIKYNQPKGSVHVSVAKTSSYIILTVKDTGIGISKDEQNLIFQRFYRVDKSRSKEIGGTGLGLSIVKHAVSLHKGSVSVESTLDKGTTIQVIFPTTLEAT